MEAFRDENFLTSLTVTLKYALFVVIIGNIVSLALALLLDTNIPGKSVLRTVFFLPNVMSLIIVGFVWTFIYGDVYRSFMEILGNPEYLQISWLGNTSIAIYSIGITAIWQSAGYAMIIYIAGLQNISTDIIEAAYIDGASAREVFFRIKLPLISPVIVMNVILATTSCLKVFDFPLAMTSGGPGYATTTMALYIYTLGFNMQRTGYATAISVILFLIIAVITVFLMKFLKMREEKL
ncbi:MAG TPA: sugar ABC transporter permease [Clostridiaceae bacterium]|nr:sugar ABC transporter permease [Clostridiaceae bacterium]